MWQSCHLQLHAHQGAFRDNPQATTLYPQDGNSLAAWFNATTSDRATRISAYLQTNWGKFGSSSPEWGDNIGTFPGSMEVWAHMAAGQTQRSLDLIRLQWGYMLSKNESTQSTFWEGYNKDGSFAYQGIYMSNSHGWAAGPGGALTYHVAGIRPVTAGGLQWRVAPQIGDLTSTDGSLTFPGGRSVRVVWQSAGWADAVSPTPAKDASFSMMVDSRTNTGSIGFVGLPLPAGLTASDVVVTADGRPLWEKGALHSSVGRGLRAEVLGTHLVFSPWPASLSNFTITRQQMTLDV